MTELPLETRRAARRLRYATIAGTAALELVLLVAAFVLVTGRRAEMPALHIHDSGVAPWPAALTLLLMALLIGLALWSLVRMLATLESPAPFAAAKDLRAFAFWLFLGALASVLAPPLLSLAFGSHRAAFALGGTDLLMLLVSGLLFLVARLLEQAQAIADDHDQIV